MRIKHLQTHFQSYEHVHVLVLSYIQYTYMYITYQTQTALQLNRLCGQYARDECVAPICPTTQAQHFDKILLAYLTK